MKDRRRIRRSSPDAPQGFVPVLTVFAGLVVVAVVAGLGFVGSGGTSSDTGSGDRVTTPDEAGPDGSTTIVPTTVLIRGEISTSLFVTTTTPITTTTSTTTTTLPGPVLDATESEVVFGPGQTSVSFTVHSSDPDGVTFEVTGVPPGMSVSPMRAVVAEGLPVTVTVKIVDAAAARSGTLVLVGDDGSRVTVGVRLESESFSIVAVGFDPDPPVCGTPSRMIVLVTGSGVASVAAVITGASGTNRVSLSSSGGGSWSVGLPDGPAGSSVSGTVVATADDGTTAAKTFSTTLATGPGCGRSR